MKDINQKIVEYIAKQQSPQKEILLEIRNLIKNLIPLAEEKMSYGVPSFKLDGKSILYAAFKNHVGIYPEPEVIENFKKELSAYETSKGTIKFSLEKPIPYNLIKEIVVFKYELLNYPTNFPKDLILELPEKSNLPLSTQHYLLYIKWQDKYLDLVPSEFKTFFKKTLPLLSARTTDVHVAVCMSFLDEFINKFKDQYKNLNRNVIAYSLMLHDIGWSQMSEEEIAASLGVEGLVLSKEAIGPKEKHAVLGEKLARQILIEQQKDLNLSEAEIELICKAILYHDKPEEVAGFGKAVPIEISLLADLDHLWSFTRLNFWQDVMRKDIEPKTYLENLRRDLEKYFVTEVGKTKAQELLSDREKEINA